MVKLVLIIAPEWMKASPTAHEGENQHIHNMIKYAENPLWFCIVRWVWYKMINCCQQPIRGQIMVSVKCQSVPGGQIYQNHFCLLLMLFRPCRHVDSLFFAFWGKFLKMTTCIWCVITVILEQLLVSSLNFLSQ